MKKKALNQQETHEETFTAWTVTSAKWREGIAAFEQGVNVAQIKKAREAKLTPKQEQALEKTQKPFRANSTSSTAKKFHRF